jgi:hypothetical protein
MPSRRSFKTDESLLEKLATAAIGGRAVFGEVQRQGHKPIEQQRGAMDYRDCRNTDMPAALPNLLYTTRWGQACVGDSLDLLLRLPADFVDLALTSPPFVFQRQKRVETEGADGELRR